MSGEISWIKTAGALWTSLQWNGRMSNRRSFFYCTITAPNKAISSTSVRLYFFSFAPQSVRSVFRCHKFIKWKENAQSQLLANFLPTGQHFTIERLWMTFTQELIWKLQVVRKVDPTSMPRRSKIGLPSVPSVNNSFNHQLWIAKINVCHVFLKENNGKHDVKELFLVWTAIVQIVPEKGANLFPAIFLYVNRSSKKQHIIWMDFKKPFPHYWQYEFMSDSQMLQLFTSTCWGCDKTGKNTITWRVDKHFAFLSTGGAKGAKHKMWK